MTASIAIIGTGYVGLVSGTCFAELGHSVICVDRDYAKIEKLKNGQLPIYEPGLEELVTRNVARGRLDFTTNLAEAVRNRDAVFLAVGTPTLLGSERADLSFVEAAASEVAASVNSPTVLVTKSTVPVGTNRRLVNHVRSLLSNNARLSIVSNPEFLREGAAIGDFMEPDRIVIGTDDDFGLSVMHKIYAPLLSKQVPLVVTGVETAEVIKYAANAFLATKVSFINEIADLCEKVGANVGAVAEGIGLDKRIGGSFLNAGPGWGGSCFPKDTKALISSAQEVGVRLDVVQAAVSSNARRKTEMVDRIGRLFGGNLRGRRIAVLGLTFKGQTDDMRDSPAVDVVNGLIAGGATVSAFDPSSPHEARHILPNVQLTDSATAAAHAAEVLVILTDWKVFKSENLSEIAEVMTSPVMVDLRNLFDPDEAFSAGFSHYECIGTLSSAGAPNG